MLKMLVLKMFNIYIYVYIYMYIYIQYNSGPELLKKKL